ncbi:dTDP-4-dehydrorhamnose reductase [Cryobacterium sp. W22_MBD10_FK3]|uniref:dTDP-4-dehydrorhamnose reductase n=1 Tax=Cryobacterium sp. W22_MBD10_FK3 TaxID=3240273 RepID=UPI003F8E3DB8
MTRYLITGAAGMLGRDLQGALAGRDITAVDRAELDITDLAAVREAVTGHDVIINAAAYTAVDAAEENEAAAYAVNALGPRNLAIGAAAVGAKLVQISTDYVFDGAGNRPYPEDTEIDPINAYGRTKAAGEQFVLTENPAGSYIVRTAWLYGAHGPNFGRTMLTLAAGRDTVSVVADQFGQPTWTVDLAAQIVALLDADAPVGIYHGTNSGQTNWFGFAKAVFANAGLDPKRVLPTDSSQFVRPAPRPAYSVLGHDAWAAAGLTPMRPWTEALTDAASHGAFDPS